MLRIDPPVSLVVCALIALSTISPAPLKAESFNSPALALEPASLPLAASDQSADDRAPEPTASLFILLAGAIAIIRRRRLLQSPRN